MNVRRLRIITIVGPIGFVVAAYAIHYFFFQDRTTWISFIFILSLISAGTVLFSGWVFQVINRQQVELNQRSEALAQALESERKARAQLAAANLKLTQLNSLTEALEHLEPQSLMDELLQRIRQTLEADIVAILLKTADGKELAVRATQGLQANYWQQVCLPSGQGFAGRVATERRVLVLSIEQAGLMPEHQMKQRELGIRWLMGAPIMVEQQLLGVITLSSRRESAYHEDEMDVFGRFASRIGSVLERARLIQQSQQAATEADQKRRQLEALHEASLKLSTELDLDEVLQTVVDLSRELVNAKYGALGVLDDDAKYLQQFITSGLDPEVRARIGNPPQGHGVLGVVIKTGQTIRIPEISADERSVGFPPNHPPMHSLLAVPIRSKGGIIGDLYMTDKKSSADGETYGLFSESDEQVLEQFATEAAIAIENAQLHRRTQRLALLQERERFGRDLHDGIIQSIYAIGLSLEEAVHVLDHSKDETRTFLQSALKSLNDVIRDIRNYILDLRPQRFQGRDLKAGLQELVRELRARTILKISIHDESADISKLTNEQTVGILHILQEALTNVSKHARASRVEVTVANSEEGALVLTITDNGVGFDPVRASKGPGHGLRNMRERARALNGELEITPKPDGGTCLTLEVAV